MDSQEIENVIAQRLRELRPAVEEARRLEQAYAALKAMRALEELEAYGGSDEVAVELPKAASANGAGGDALSERRRAAVSSSERRMRRAPGTVEVMVKASLSDAPKTSREIARLTGLKASTVHTTMHRLSRRGRVERVGVDETRGGSLWKWK